jgi:uncharacterized membrane protein
MTSSTHTLGTPLAVWTLPAWRPRALTVQAFLLVAAAWLLPALAHAAGLPARTLLPMHWPVILVGLCYGWRSGALVGLGAPALSFLLSGMPPPIVLPAMTLELGAYGFLAGFARETLRQGWFVAALASLLGGRLVFLAAVLLTGALTTSWSAYLAAAMLPGLPAALAQAALLPLLARWWVRREQRR